MAEDSSGRAGPLSPGRLRAVLDDPRQPDWERPGPTAAQQRYDVALAALLLVSSQVCVALMSSIYGSAENPVGRGDYVAAAGMAACLVVRRRFPLATMLLASAAFLGLSYLGQAAAVSVVYQICCFAAIYTGTAWARNRRALWLCLAGVLVAMFLWLVLTWTLTNSLRELLHTGNGQGPWDPLTSVVVYQTGINLAYFGGAIAFGRSTWRAALRRSELEEQARQLAAQSERLSRQAVVEERLRLARELHDSVGHHFTGVGLLAGGTRRLLARGSADGPLRLDAAESAQARDSLAAIEEATRDGVAELQTVLGVLRGGAEDEPEETLADLSALVERVRALGVAVETSVVPGPSLGWEDVLDGLRPSEQLGFHRMVQEALTNVVKHSDATTARLVLRVLEDPAPALEAEVTDGGHPARHPDAELLPSSGMGLQGLAERARALGGRAESGPRTPGPGWFVRFRIPVRGLAADGTAPTPTEGHPA